MLVFVTLDETIVHSDDSPNKQEHYFACNVSRSRRSQQRQADVHVNYHLSVDGGGLHSTNKTC